MSFMRISSSISNNYPSPAPFLCHQLPGFLLHPAWSRLPCTALSYCLLTTARLTSSRVPRSPRSPYVYQFHPPSPRPQRLQPPTESFSLSTETSSRADGSVATFLWVVPEASQEADALGAKCLGWMTEGVTLIHPQRF